MWQLQVPLSGWRRTDRSYKNDDTILRFIDNAIDQGLPSDLMDDLYLISINRSDILLPQLVERLQNRDRQDVLVPKTRNGVLDLVAYSANERSLDVLSDLCSSASEDSCNFIRQVFQYTDGRRNPFSLMYYSLAKPNVCAGTAARDWMIDTPHRRLLAAALVERYKQSPAESELREDPILSTLTGSQTQGVRDQLPVVLREATERQRSR